MAAIGAMVACAVLHLASLATSPPASGLMALVMLGMGLACLPCATRAALLPTRRTWLHGAAVSVAMLVAHPVLGLLSSGHSMHGHAVAVPEVITLGLALGPLLSLALATCAAWATAPQSDGGLDPRRGSPS